MRILKTLFIALMIPAFPAVAQKILLVGTMHRTSADHINDVQVIAEALKKFHPDAICVEYPMPRDTASWLWRDRFWFESIDQKKKSWGIGADYSNVEMLKSFIAKHPSDAKARLRFIEQLYLLNDRANADYESYVLFSQIGSSMRYELNSEFASYPTLRDNFERERLLASEYSLLVFPLAQSLEFDHLYAIDDLSNWSEYEKYDELFKRSTDSVALSHRALSKAFHQKVDSASRSNNKWLYLNSAALRDDLLLLELYHLPPGYRANENAVKRHEVWVSRNAKMAMYIRNVALQYPTKKIVVFVGVSHVWALKEELEKTKGKYKVLTLNDLIGIDFGDSRARSK